MRFLVYGAGAVGGYFGGRLAQAGHDVVFLARGANLHALRENGLRVGSIEGDFQIDPVVATDEIASVGPVDVILLGVKAWQVDDAARSMLPLIGENTVVIPLQNGVEAPLRLTEVLGPGPVLGGMCGVIAQLAGPGHIRHVAAPPVIRFGELDDTRSDRVKRVLDAFADARGLRAEVPASITSAMWEKFLLIAAFSGIGAITRVPVGEFRRDGGARVLLERAMREIADVAAARDVTLARDCVEATLRGFDSLPPEATASMQRDITAGRPSELEAQTGAVVRLGRESGVDTPVNAFVYDCLLPQERLAREGQRRTREPARS